MNMRAFQLDVRFVGVKTQPDRAGPRLGFAGQTSESYTGILSGNSIPRNRAPVVLAELHND